MKLNKDQQEKVVENMKLVGKVIKDKVHMEQYGIFSYEDLQQIGYIGLCKAAYTDKGGCFSTYAYRLIWHEICDALIKANRIQSRETELSESIKSDMVESNSVWEIQAALEAAEMRASDTIRKGMEALRYSADGYSSREIGAILHAPDNKVRMWMTRARRFLQSQPELLALADGYINE